MNQKEVNNLKQITIRGIPDGIAKIIKTEAKEKHLSLNKVLISLLEKATGIKSKSRKIIYHDLDHLFGVWSKKDAEMFEKNVKTQRKIDQDLWKKPV